MQISDKMKALREIARKLAEDPEFLKQTAHRRKPQPVTLTPSEQERTRQTAKTQSEWAFEAFKRHPIAE